MKRITRRTLLAATVPLAAAINAQDSTIAQESRAEDLKSARDSIANNAALLAKVEVPIAIEPAFVFKA